MRKVIVYIAASFDGFISAPNDDLSYLELVEQKGEDYGYTDFIKTIDTINMGRKTQDWLMRQVPVFPHASMKTYIGIQTARPDSGNIEFYAVDLSELITKLKKRQGKNIFIDGGAEVVNEFLRLRLAD